MQVWCMKKTYTIFAALSDETNERWVWFRCPPFPTRTIVKVHYPKTGRTIFCESRKIDPNFLEQYNGKEHTLKIQNECEALVISKWYRNALGGFETKGKVDLEITQSKCRTWGSLRASCNHPDISVRVGTRLGVLGTWLGFVGLAAALFDLKSYYGASSLVVLAVVGGIIGYLVCRGAKPATS
jgi:hypothetical protein